MPDCGTDLARSEFLRHGWAHLWVSWTMSIRIATYNVNGINGRLANLLGWLEEAAPDIVCLQELKAPDDKFPAGRAPRCRLRRDLARAEELERCGDPRPRR